jgi:rhodanese-related sulfurtransferase
MKPDLRNTIRSAVPTAVAMLVMSVAIGLAYNSATPLGVRRSAGMNSSKPAAQTAAAPAPAPASNVRTGYHNQTLSMSFAPLTAAIPPASPTVAAATGAASGGDAKAAYAELTWPETKALVGSGKAVLVDARVATAFDTEHIPGAVSLPAGSPAAAVTAFLSRYPKDTQFVIYCGSSKCGMSHMIADAMKNAGANSSQIRIMPGGYVEYRTSEPQGGSK